MTQPNLIPGNAGHSPQWTSFRCFRKLLGTAKTQSRTREGPAHRQAGCAVPGRFARYICELVCFSFAIALVNCESTNFAPPRVTPELARASAPAHTDEKTLREGRTLFVSRCIECHTLPVVSRYKASDWPCLVDEMAERANLKLAERDAIVAYILAARAH
jgi:hypothetical protein